MNKQDLYAATVKGLTKKQQDMLFGLYRKGASLRPVRMNWHDRQALQVLIDKGLVRRAKRGGWRRKPDLGDIF